MGQVQSDKVPWKKPTARMSSTGRGRSHSPERDGPVCGDFPLLFVPAGLRAGKGEGAMSSIPSLVVYSNPGPAFAILLDLSNLLQKQATSAQLTRLLVRTR